MQAGAIGTAGSSSAPFPGGVADPVDLFLGGPADGADVLATKASVQASTLRADLSVLSNGARGSDVRLLQNSLNALGFDSGRADGIVGRQQTWPALNDALHDRRDSLLRDADAIGIGTPVGRALLQDAERIDGLLGQLDGSRGPVAPPPTTLPTPVPGLHPTDPAGLLDNPNMNPAFVQRVETVLDQLRAEG